MTKIKICCHTCNNAGYIKDFSYPDVTEVKIVCPECDGKKYVMFEKWVVPKLTEEKKVE